MRFGFVIWGLLVAVVFHLSAVWHTNEANGSFSIVLTHQPRPHAAVNKRNLAYLNRNSTGITAIIKPRSKVFRCYTLL